MKAKAQRPAKVSKRKGPVGRREDSRTSFEAKRSRATTFADGEAERHRKRLRRYEKLGPDYWLG